MEANKNLVRDLPAGLEAQLSKVITPGENKLVSLPGAFGEGIVVTDRRAIILRENVSAIGTDAGVDVYVYPLANITGVNVTNTANGGVIVIDASGAPQEIEKRAVFFPSYELEKFNAAGEVVKEMLAAGVQASPQAAQRQEVTASVDADHCSQCGAKIRDFALFCPSCGANIGFRCGECGERVPNGSAYCPGCGTVAVPEEGKCQGCGRMMAAAYTFCPWCGQSQTNKCYVCGVSVSKSWVFCANCGRKLGSDVIDPRTLRSAYSRASEDTQTSPIFGQKVDVEAAEPVKDGGSPAAQHNERGKALFEQDDLDGAIEEFRLAVELDPQNSAYHCNLAVALDENDEDEEAHVEYDKTLQLNPNDTTALLYIGYMYNEDDKPEEAARAWQRLIEIDPKSADAEEARENLRHLGAL
jgi:tetratricopeptide (TPR) repeat protein